MGANRPVTYLDRTMSTTATSPARVRTALLVVQFLFGVNYLVSKGIVTALDPAAWAVIRSTSALAILAVVALIGRRRLPPLRDVALLAVAGIFGVTLNQGLFLEGLARTTVSRSALICAQIPTFVLLFSLVARQERLTVRKTLGFLAGLGGVAVLLEADRFSLDARWLAGDLLTLANAASYALFVVIGRKVMARNDPLAATTVVFFFGALGLAAYGGPAVMDVAPGDLDGRLLAAMAFAVLGATVATYFLNMWAIKRATATRVALFIFLQPVVASLLGVVFRDEQVTPRFVVATLLVFAALALRDGPNEKPLAESTGKRP
ncbi:MAG: DMT family transporter [bacterium]|nr:DMT family transporter [bacterium]